MRDSFHKELEALDQEIVRLGALVERATQNATTALIESDRGLAQKVIRGDDEIDRVFLDIETRALTLMAQQAPVARDLRLLVAIMGVVGDLERAGDLANNIADFALMEDFRQPGLKGVRELVVNLGDAASRLMAASIDAWVAKDLLLAAAIDDRDDELDDLDAQLLETLVELKGQESLGPALRLALVGRYLERIGDHAVNLAERVRYFVTGDEEYLG